jgi:hypothetical protein
MPDNRRKQRNLQDIAPFFHSVVPRNPLRRQREEGKTMMHHPTLGRERDVSARTASGVNSRSRPNTTAFDSERFYANPDAIVGDTGLSRAEQLRLLDEWAQDLADRQVATSEGMLPPSPAVSGDDAQLLNKLSAGIESVEDAEDQVIGPLTRVWRRLTTS